MRNRRKLMAPMCMHECVCKKVCVECSDGGLSGRSVWNVNACWRGTRVPSGVTRPNAAFSNRVLSTALHTTKDVLSSINHHTHETHTHYATVHLYNMWYLKKLANTVQQNLHMPLRLLIALFSMCTWEASVCKHQQATAFSPLNNAALVTNPPRGRKLTSN